MDAVNTTSTSHDSCPKCGIPISNDMEFCAECGHSLTTKCPSCAASMRWHMKHCPKCGVNIEKKKAELAAEAERKRQEEALQNKEREGAQKRLQEERKICRQRRRTWWRKIGWKLVAGLVLVGLGTVYLVYRNSDLYAYRQAEKLFEASQLREAVSAFNALGNYRDSGARALAIRYQIADDLYQRGDLTGALAEYSSLAGYRGSRIYANSIRYEMAEGLYYSGDVSGAYNAFRALGAYRDSDSRASSIRFQKNGEIITDYANGLDWQLGPDRGTNWNEAKAWVEDLGGDWRMPTRAELKGLWDAGINSWTWGLFENGGCFVWSGEVYDLTSAWYVYFGYYFGGRDGWDTSSLSYGDGRAFAVRSHQYL